MHVLHVVSTGERRGAEIFASDLVGALDAMGVDQHVVVIRSSRQDVSYAARSSVLGPDGPAVRGLRLHPSRIRRLRRLVDTFKPDVLQAHGAETLRYAVAASYRRTGPPIVYRNIGRVRQSSMWWPRNQLQRGLVRCARRVVIVAEALRHDAETFLGVSPDRIVKIANGIDPRRLDTVRSTVRVREEIGIPAEAPILLSLAALTWEKDPIGHLRVAARVLDRCPHAYFVLAGDGPLRRDVERAISVDGFGDRVRFLGSRSDPADLLTVCDALLLASRSEGMPGTVIEAGMLGVPVAAYDIAGVPEVVKHGVTGLLAPAGVEERLADEATCLLDDHTRSRALGEAARTWCRAQFDIASVASLYMTLYQGMGE